MMHFDSPTPKRTTLWSSSRLISAFWMGILTRLEKQKKTKKSKQKLIPVKSYIDKVGAKRYKGTADLTKTGKLS